MRASTYRCSLIFILTLLVFSGGNVTVVAVEYGSTQSCEAAKAADIRALSTVSSLTKVVGTCTQKQ